MKCGGSTSRDNPAEVRTFGWSANLQDHMRNDVAARSIAGSVALNDCMLSRYTATDEGLNLPPFPLNLLNASAPFAGHRIIPPTTPDVAAEAGPSTAYGCTARSAIHAPPPDWRPDAECNWEMCFRRPR